MILILFFLGLFAQGVSPRPDESAVVTGTLRTTDGKPAVGIRVAARAVQDLAAEQEGAALVGLGETDTMGRYRLEGVPSGRYTIAAGRVDLPTYYPGTLDLSSGRILSITAGSMTTGIDFTLADISSAAGPQEVTIPLKVLSENGGRIPVFGDGRFAQIVLASEADGRVVSSSSLAAASVILPFPVVPGRYRATVENLPNGTTLKTITYGSVNLITEAFTLSAADLPLSSGIASSANSQSPNTSRTTQELSIVLVQRSPTTPPREGARISGRLPDPDRHTIYISGIPGTLYSDGTFEVEGVPPGRQVVLSSSNNRGSFGAVVVVGNRDVENVQLDPIPLLPLEVPVVDARSPGPVIPLAGLRGQIVSDTTGQPMRGVLNVIGDSQQIAYAVGNDGKFEIPKLLPGRYILQVSIFDYFTLNQTVIIGEADSTLELRVQRAY